MEEKLQIAVQEQKKLSDYQTELDDAKLKVAQMEITQESWKKKYEKVANERKDLLAKVSKLDLELLNLKRTAKLEDSDDVKLKIARFQTENETLKSQCDNLLSERNTCKEKISELETELFDMRKKISSLEGRLRKSGEISPRSTGDSTDFQKMREEMEQRVAKELRGIGEQKKKELEELEGKYKTTILELQKQCSEKDQEMETLRKKIRTEKMEISQIGSKLQIYNQELQARRLQIEKLKMDLKEKENEVEDDRNYMAEVMTKWIAELKESKTKEKEKDEKIQKLKAAEGNLNKKIKTLVAKQKHLWSKYQTAKQTANNYKVRIRKLAFIHCFFLREIVFL